MLTSLASVFFLLQASAQPPVTPEVLDADVVRAYPHDTTAFTQGLLFANGVLIESTGLEGHSRLRKLSLRSGLPTQEYRFPNEIFAEGTALVGRKLITLTYKAQKAIIFDLATLEEEGTFPYQGEGWGLTYSGEHLIMSDGSYELRFIDPEHYHEVRRMTVTLQGEPLRQLNELEWIDGKIWANVWMQDYLVRIDPETGVVDQIADLRGLFPHSEREEPYRDVLNGIAYEPESGRLFVTGKNWPQIFEITLRPR